MSEARIAFVCVALMLIPFVGALCLVFARNA